MKLRDNLLKDFAQSAEHIKTVTQIDPTEDNIDQIYINYFKEHCSTVLLNLSPKEAFLFYHTYKREGVFLSSITNKGKEFFEPELKSLLKKGLLTYRANISQVHLAHKLYIFSEIREILQQQELFITDKDLLEKIFTLKESSLRYKISDIPNDVVQFFYSYGMTVLQDFFLQQFGEPSLEYLQKSGYVVHRIFVREIVDPEVSDKYIEFCDCLELIEPLGEEREVTVQSSIDYHTIIFNSFIKICYSIHRDGIGFTKKNEINRKNLERFTKDIESEQVLVFFINFLRTKNFLEKINDQDEIYKLNENATFSLFHNQLSLTYKSFINSDPFVKLISEILLTMSTKEFSVADVILTHLKNNLKMVTHNLFLRNMRRQVIGALEMLHYIGFITKHFTDDGMIFYTISNLTEYVYKNEEQKKEPVKYPVRVSSSLEVFANLAQLDYQSSYILNVFMDITSFSTIISYQLSRLSCARALYFGFNTQALVDVLEKYVESFSAEMAENIRSLSDSYKEGTLIPSIVLKTSSGILDQLMLQPEYKSYIIERIGPEHAIVSDDLKVKKILEESFIFFKTNPSK